MSSRFPALIPVVLACLALAAPAASQTPQSLDRRPAAVSPQSTLKLTPKERASRPALAAEEDAVRAVNARFTAQLTRLNAIRAESDRLLAERAAAEMEILATTARLKAMLPDLWTLSIAVQAGMDNAVTPWDEADRRLTWLGAAYAKGREDLGELQVKSADLHANTSRQEDLRIEMDLQQQKLEKVKDALAAESLRLMRDIQVLRQEPLTEAQELNRILELLAQYDFRPALCAKRPLNQTKGALPWPASGRMISVFAPEAKPPGMGIGLATAKDAPVKAVYWGKVVFCDTLRSLGKVVVVSHGQHAFTVYANLSKIVVRPGQDVSQDDTLGTAGWLPAAQGPGLSFELRFREKPINPTEWLTAG